MQILFQYSNCWVQLKTTQMIKWSSEYRTLFNLVLRHYLILQSTCSTIKTKQPNHSKSDQIAAILDTFILVLILNGWDYNFSCGYGPKHSNTKLDLPNIRILNGFRVGMCGIQASHCIQIPTVIKSVVTTGDDVTPLPSQSTSERRKPLQEQSSTRALHHRIDRHDLH